MARRTDPPIIELILHHPLLKIETELKKGCKDINERDRTAHTALHYCILPEKGTVKYYMGKETEIEDPNPCDFRKLKKWDEVKLLDFNNPIMEVLEKWPKRLAVAYLLCKYGADVNLDQSNKEGTY